MSKHLRSFHRLGAALCVLFAATLPGNAQVSATAPIRVAIVGLVHGHIQGFLGALQTNSNATLVGIVEPDTALSQKYAGKYHLDAKLFYTDLDKMLVQQHPDAVLVYTTIKDHRKVIEAAAKHGISSMVEKPLSTTMEDALAIRAAARQYHVQVLTNYETTWYASNAEALSEIANGKLGEVRKVVVHDGHEGPKEIGVGPEWLPWLTDPVQNGAGALFDFGCYGADLMTVMMHGAAPLSVTASGQTDKPDIYPHVEDDATAILRYPKTQAVLMPSWTWSFARKDMEVYGVNGMAITVALDHLRVRYKGEKAESEITAPPLPANRKDSLDYLAAVLRGQIKPDGDLSALDTNMVVMQILTAARESMKTGRTVELKALPQ
ncbi:Gfo/Idh/MocA family protein [Granulicella arctica]|uniref:Gfo/Idh/MocA family protein n=1 Tax=Granulicella arctica TaxID=940613 RepID=UPI0021E0C621|nr:Gfo/Idh/MocA family oxidoreductase [Granulicella arctica]